MGKMSQTNIVKTQKMNFNKITYRTNTYNKNNSIVNVRSAGHYLVNNKWEDPHFLKPFLQLFWGVRGEGQFNLGGKSWILHPEHVCYYFPGDFHDITPVSNEWEYYWFTCDGPYINTIIEAFKLKHEIYYVGQCPIELFEKLHRELLEICRGGNFRAGATAYRILSLAAAADNHPQNDMVKSFRCIVTENYHDETLSVENICKKLFIHRSTLTRQIHKQLGVSPQEYIIAYRIQNALKLLCESSKSIKEISGDTGFSDHNYFGKVIKKRLGRSPGEIRRNSSWREGMPSEQ